MKFFKMLPLLALVALLTSGCAKPVEETEAPADTASEAVSSTEDTYGSGYDDGSFSEDEVTDTTSSEDTTADTELEVELERIHFAFDKYDLDTDARQTLQNNALYMEQNPDTRIILEGHCDERGSDEYNLALGEKRARAAAQYLENLGVDSDRIRTISYGEEKPLDPASNKEAWTLNRRAEFKPQQ
ncbi:MAG: peptidoglycan-associated lipoprotein Pal [Desulfuromonadaceae bacterium]|nr:peptidoglycan-associated lipoprotein Pal [Geobacteraceae bacterium]